MHGLFYLHCRCSHVLLYVNLAGASSPSHLCLQRVLPVGRHFNFVLAIILYMDVFTFNILFFIKFMCNTTSVFCFMDGGVFKKSFPLTELFLYSLSFRL